MQFELTPKALANFSPGVASTLGKNRVPVLNSEGVQDHPAK
jgi:hypothetical protein